MIHYDALRNNTCHTKPALPHHNHSSATPPQLQSTTTKLTLTHHLTITTLHHTTTHHNTPHHTRPHHTTPHHTTPHHTTPHHCRIFIGSNDIDSFLNRSLGVAAGLVRYNQVSSKRLIILLPV